MLREGQGSWRAREGAQAALSHQVGGVGGGCGGLCSWRRRWGQHECLSIFIPRGGEGKRWGSCGLTDVQQSGWTVNCGKPAEMAAW